MFGDRSHLVMPTRDDTYTEITKLVIKVSDDSENFPVKEDITQM